MDDSEHSQRPASPPADSNARLERQRALNRARQRRYQSRKRNGANGVILDDNGQPNSTLTRIAHNLAAGMSNNQALIQAGSSPDARSLITKAKAGLAEALKAKGLDTSNLLDGVKELRTATRTVLTANGSIVEPHWEVREKGVRHQVDLLDRAGEIAPVSSTPSGPSILVQILRFEQPQPVVDITPDNDCETLTIEKQ